MNFKIILSCILMISFWSSAFVVIQAVMRSGISSAEFVCYRLLVSSIFMVVISLFVPFRKFSFFDFCLTFLAGFLGTYGYVYLVNYAQMTVSSIETCIVINTMPIFSLILAWILFKQKVSYKVIFGMILSFTGIVFISLKNSTESFGFNQGVVYLILASFFMAVSTVIHKKLMSKYESIQVIGWGIFSGLLVSLLMGDGYDLSFESYEKTTHLMIIYLAIGPSGIGYLCWGYLLKRLSTQQCTSLIYFIPLLTALQGYFFLGEVLTWLSFLGGILVIFGVYMSQRSKA